MEAELDRLDALVARNRANFVAAWGYGEITKEQREAEWKELQQSEPPHLGLGASVPQDWNAGDGTDARKWQNASLRKNMGLQASKPRKANDKPTDAAGKASEDSSDEEEGRTGLGRTRKTKHGHKYRGGESNAEGVAKPGLIVKEVTDDVVDMETHTTSFQEILAHSKQEPSLEKVESWKQKTANALIQSPTLPSHASFSTVSDSAQQDRIKTSVQENNPRETILEVRVREKGKKSKKRKLAEYGDVKRSHDEFDGEMTKAKKAKISGGPTGNSHTKGSSFSKTSKQGLVQPNKLRDGRTGDVKAGDEDDVNRETPTQADAETMAKMRQLARERLGSGSYSKKKRGAKVKSTNR